MKYQIELFAAGILAGVLLMLIYNSARRRHR